MRETDVSDLLRPGAYTLGLHGRVVFAGKTKCLLTALSNHRAAWDATEFPAWLGFKRFRFDSMSIIPCSPDQADHILRALIAHHSPIHNSDSYRVGCCQGRAVSQSDSVAISRMERRI